MAEFLSVLSFSMVPLVMLLLFSIITPPLGATLSLRNEILLGIALPPMGSAIIAAAIVAGVQSESTIALYGITALLLFLLMIVLPLGAAQGRISLRRRELVLAGLFCIGNAVTMLLMGISPLAEAHFRSLLQGELLAVSMAQLWAVAAACGLLLFALVRFRGALYAYALDEEGLFIREKSYRLIALVYRLAATLVITGGIVLIGPLLTTSLLIVPAFLCERDTRGLDRFIIVTMGVGVTGALAGFLGAVLVNQPPAAVIVSMVIVCGVVARFMQQKR